MYLTVTHKKREFKVNFDLEFLFLLPVNELMKIVVVALVILLLRVNN